MNTPQESSSAQAPTAGTAPSPLELFNAALRGRNSGRPPVWLMRQAGRYLSEYRAIRDRYSFKEMCDRPEIAVEVSLLPHHLFDLDAVIVFYDILMPLEKMGAPLVYGPDGPKFTEPLRRWSEFDKLHPIDPLTSTTAILTAIHELVKAVGARKPVLGFGGAPFTLASYLIGGGSGEGVEALKKHLYQEPAFVHALLEKLTAMTIDYLQAQFEAGASAVQLFDTWAGALDRRDYRTFALPYQQRVFKALKDWGGDAAPSILYVRDAAHLKRELEDSGADALSLEWRVEFEAMRRLNPRRPLQGNLDPLALFLEAGALKQRILEILESRRGDPAFIFNLGHGVVPRTPVDNVRLLVETVKSFKP